MPKQPIQFDPVIFNEFTGFIGGKIPIDPDTEEPYELTEEQEKVRADMERILRTVQGLRRNLDIRQEDYKQLKIHIGKDVRAGFYQDYVSGKLSNHHFGQ